jgi:peptide/nickel transport system substrate-binding protein
MIPVLRAMPVLRRLAVAAVAAVSMITAPSAFAERVVAVMQSPLRLLDPVVSSAAISNTHGFMIYDTLLGLDSNHKIHPQMADKWEVSPDGLTYTFTLRPGLKWHDGAPVRAEDCVASIKRWGQLDLMGQVLLDLTTEMKVVDDSTFQIVLKSPSNVVLAGLAKIGTRTPFMMPKRVAETPASEQIRVYIGSGPFKFVAAEFKPGLKVVYERNTDYVPRNEPPSGTAGGKVVKVDRVEWISMPDAMTTVNALINGEVDYVENLQYDLLPMLSGKSGIKVAIQDKLGLWTYIRFNFLHPPLDNKLVRRAAMYAVGQKDILTALTGDPKYFRTCAAVFGCGTPHESSYGSEILIESNVEKAKQLLKEAGYKGEPVVILHPTDNPQVSAQPVVIASALRKAGFAVELQSMDWQSVAARRASRKPLAEGGWSIHATTGPLIGITDPLRNQTVAANGDKAWFGWPNVPQIEKLRAKYAVTSDPAELKALAESIQKLVIDEGVVVPMGQFVIPTGYSTRLSGLLEASVALFWNLSKEGK